MQDVIANNNGGFKNEVTGFGEQNAMITFYSCVKLVLSSLLFINTQKKFVKGLRQHGKNFYKIRKELLPYKETVSS